MKSVSQSKRLRTKIRLAEPCLLEVSDHFWTHAQLAQMFPEFLFMMHSIIRSSVSLLNGAADAAERRADFDAAARKIALRVRSPSARGRRWARFSCAAVSVIVLTR